MPLDQRHLGKYRLISLLGKGGMAEVYLAEHELLQSKVAVKILPPELARDQGMVDRFMREARAAARLNHPNIIRIHDVGSEGGLNYFAMDYLEGSALTKLIAGSKAMELERVLQISREVLSALAEAHQAGIVHRDIKPDNVIITQRGIAVVTDFGIAKAASDARLTSTGAFVGTPRYASPEQVQGREVDGRSDLYSWGLVMYEMVCGRSAFAGPDTSAYIYQQVHEVAAAPHDLKPDLPPGLSAMILKALEKRPEDRFSSAGEMLAALERAVPGLSSAGSQAGPSSQSRARALLTQAQACLRNGQWREGRDLATKAKELDPGLSVASQVLEQARAELARDERISNLSVEAQACLNEGLYERAAQIISDLVGVSRDKERVLAWLEEAQELQKQAQAILSELQRGQALENAGDLGAALGFYRELAQRHSDSPRVAQAVARLENRLAVQDLAAQARSAAESGDPRAAQDLYLQALRLEPSNAKVKAGLQEVQSRMSKGQRARALVAQGRLLMEHRDFGGAQTALTEALGLDPTIAEAATLLDQAQAQSGKATVALSDEPGPTVGLASEANATVAFSSSPAVDLPPPTSTWGKPGAAAAPGPAPSRKGLWLGLGGLGVLILGLGLWLGLKPSAPPVPPPSPPAAPTAAAPSHAPAAPVVPAAPAATAATATPAAPAAPAATAAPTATAPVDPAVLAQQEAKALAERQAQEEARRAAEAQSKAKEEEARKKAEVEGKAQEAAKARQELDNKVQALVDRGEVRASAGHFDEAAKLWREALALKPGVSGVQKRLAGLEERRKEWAREQAEAQARKGAQATLPRGIDAFNAGNYQEAVNQLTVYIKAYPGDGMAQSYLTQAQEMIKGQNQGALVVECAPAAEVLLDGKPVGKTPLRHPTAVGLHKVEVRAFGGDASQQVDIKGRATTTIRFQLLGGGLAINSVPWANITMDGKPLGQTPLSLDNLPLGPHRVRAGREGFSDSEQEVILMHGKKSRLNFRLDQSH